MNELPNLDPTFHQPVRTRLAVLLSQGPVSFSKLKGALQITDGNLDRTFVSSAQRAIFTPGRYSTAATEPTIVSPAAAQRPF